MVEYGFSSTGLLVGKGTAPIGSDFAATVLSRSLPLHQPDQKAQMIKGLRYRLDEVGGSRQCAGSSRSQRTAGLMTRRRSAGLWLLKSGMGRKRL